MTIDFCKEYNSEKLKGTPCVILHCLERNCYWIGKKVSSTFYYGSTNILYDKKFHKTRFIFSESLSYETVSGNILKYYINEEDYDKFIDKIKTIKEIKMLIGMLKEI